VVPSERTGLQWTANGFEKWRLLAHEGRSVVYIAKQLGHGADVALRTYQHVIDELEDRPALAAEDAIREAREARKTLHVTG
jgi:hypothetical protein